MRSPTTTRTIILLLALHTSYPAHSDLIPFVVVDTITPSEENTCDDTHLHHCVMSFDITFKPGLVNDPRYTLDNPKALYWHITGGGRTGASPAICEEGCPTPGYRVYDYQHDLTPDALGGPDGFTYEKFQRLALQAFSHKTRYSEPFISTNSVVTKYRAGTLAICTTMASVAQTRLPFFAANHCVGIQPPNATCIVTGSLEYDVKMSPNSTRSTSRDLTFDCKQPTSVKYTYRSITKSDASIENSIHMPNTRLPRGVTSQSFVLTTRVPAQTPPSITHETGALTIEFD